MTSTSEIVTVGFKNHFWRLRKESRRGFRDRVRTGDLKSQLFKSAWLPV